MGILDKFLGESIAKPIEAVGNIIDDVWDSDEELMSKKAVLQKIQNSPYLAALQISLEEAKSGDKWTSRARPFGLYVFWAVFGIQSGLMPIMWWIWQTFDKTLSPPPAVLSSSDVMAVMAGILGTSWIASRGMEKIKGAA